MIIRTIESEILPTTYEGESRNIEAYTDQLNYCGVCIFAHPDNKNNINCEKMIDDICEVQEYCNERFLYNEIEEEEK